jgi:hypothetical protein
MPGLSKAERSHEINQLMQKLNSLPTMERIWCEKHIHAYFDDLPNAVDGSDPETFEEWREKQNWVEE